MNTRYTALQNLTLPSQGRSSAAACGTAAEFMPASVVRCPDVPEEGLLQLWVRPVGRVLEHGLEPREVRVRCSDGSLDRAIRRLVWAADESSPAGVTIVLDDVAFALGRTLSLDVLGALLQFSFTATARDSAAEAAAREH